MSIHLTSDWDLHALGTTDYHRTSAAHHAAGHLWAAARGLTAPLEQSAASALTQAAWFEASVQGESDFVFADYSSFPFVLIREAAHWAMEATGCSCAADVEATMAYLSEDATLQGMLSGISAKWRHICVLAEVLKADPVLGVDEARMLLAIDLDEDEQTRGPGSTFRAGLGLEVVA